MLEMKTITGEITSVNANYIMTPKDIARHAIKHSYELNRTTLITVTQEVIDVYYGKCSTVLLVRITQIESRI